MIGRSVLDTLTARDVLRLAGHEAPAQRKPMRCLFHDERSASLSILERGFRCFGCGAHGGLLDLAIGVGIGHDRASAARALEERLHHG